MLEMRDTGIEGCRKRGKEERRVQDRRDAEQERCWKGGIQEWGDAGQEGCRNVEFRGSSILTMVVISVLKLQC